MVTQRCDNTIGSYTCIRLQGCGTGYTLNAATGQCEDDDECILNTHNCIAPYECRNTIGSFRCHKVRATTTPRPTTTTTQKTFRQQYQPPSHTRYNTDAQNEELNRHYGPCDAGFERNDQGACSGIYYLFFDNLTILIIILQIFHARLMMEFFFNFYIDFYKNSFYIFLRHK